MKILIIEDEPPAAKRLAKLVNEVAEDAEVEGIIDNVEDAAKHLATNPQPDLMLMDIQLSDGLSFEILEMVNVKCPVIFTTAYDEYALRAFKVNAMDYLLKPIKKEELREAIAKYRVQKAKPANYDKLIDALKEGRQGGKKVLLKLGQSLRVFDLNEAAYYYSENKITFLMGKEGKRYPLDHSLDQLESDLDEDKFFRVNRQFLVNEESIQNMYAYSKSRVKLDLKPKSETDVIVSKDKSARFKKWLVDEE